MDDFNALAIAHQVSDIVKLLAQQENLLVLDGWTACFMSPDYTKFVKVSILLKLSSTTEMQEDKIHQEYRTVEVMLSCFQMKPILPIGYQYDALLQRELKIFLPQ